MKTKPNFVRVMMSLVLAAVLISAPSALSAFEGRITANVTQGGRTEGLLYTAGTNFLRVEMTATNWPNPVDILDRNTGELTLLFPNNRSFVRLKPTAENSSAIPPGFPQMPGASGTGILPVSPSRAETGPAGSPSHFPDMPARQGIGPTNLSGMPAMPAMPMMPSMMEKMELHKTGQKTNLLGFACEQYEIKQRSEKMEIWATAQLFPFQPYVRNQPHRFGPRMIEEQWGDMLKAKRLFPLLATLKFDNGAERFRFEVTSVTPQKLMDEDLKLFQPPDGYFEMEPLPF